MSIRFKNCLSAEEGEEWIDLVRNMSKLLYETVSFLLVWCAVLCLPARLKTLQLSWSSALYRKTNSCSNENTSYTSSSFYFFSPVKVWLCSRCFRRKVGRAQVTNSDGYVLHF
jgi:hypothetical protein